MVQNWRLNSKKKAMTGSSNSFVSKFTSPGDNSIIRNEGFEALEYLPAPTRRSERWKYSPITKLLTNSLSTKESDSTVWPQEISPNPVPHLDAYLIVFRNGVFISSLSDLPVSEGVVCSPMSSAGDQVFTNTYHKTEWVGAMNAAYHQDGMYLRVEKNGVLDRPIIVHHLTDGTDAACFPRHLISIAEGAEANVVVWSSATSESTGMNNGVLEAHIASNAHLKIDKICNENGEVFHFSHEQIIQESSSNYSMNTFTIMGHWVRNELNILSNGSGTDSVFNGTFLPTGSEHVDNHTTMDHAHPDGTSSELYRGIMYDNSTGVFNGKIFVRKDAQRTNAYQQNTNIVADKGASINAKPELEIYADDVKCSHGCTVGQFDTEALFYLMSRGIDLKSAKSLLVRAFVGDVLNSVKSEDLRNEIMNLYSEKHNW